MSASTPALQPTLIDRLLEPYRVQLGTDFTAYRNHCVRVGNFCMALSAPEQAPEEKIATAAAFHDLGIWTDGTFDYLPHSLRLATGYLESVDRAGWIPEITTMIAEHHKITPYRDRPEWLVEPFRKADLVDLSLGLVRFGLDVRFIRKVRDSFPNSGFHKRLLELTWKRVRSDPFDPLPMMKW
jgi:hypothetical protein